MDKNPECCEHRMEFVSQISTGKFYEITTWRCSVCESELVQRTQEVNHGNQNYTHRPTSEAYQSGSKAGGRE